MYLVLNTIISNINQTQGPKFMRHLYSGLAKYSLSLGSSHIRLTKLLSLGKDSRELGT